MMAKPFSTPWNAVGTVPISELSDTRLQLHWAAQIVASFGNAVIESRADDSQSNLGWVDDLGALCSHPSSEGLSVGLRLADLTLLFLDREKKVTSELGLQGHTLQQGFEWLTSEYTYYSGTAPRRPFTLREYEMPPHPVGQQAAFTCENILAYKEFQSWYANAHQVLHALSVNWKQASPLRCWPHHFDIATLVILDPNKGTEEARSVGCGMSPGDGTYAEPYFYVTLWPYPEKSQLPNMTVGTWHTEGWIGAILTASDLIGRGPVETQAERVHQFFQDSTTLGFKALGANPT